MIVIFSLTFLGGGRACLYVDISKEMYSNGLRTLFSGFKFSQLEMSEYSPFNTVGWI